MRRLIALWCVTATAWAAPVHTEVVRTEQGWALHRDGKPYLIRGAGGSGDLARLHAFGANSVRTWGADDLEPLLDEAHALGMTVTVGIWLGHKRHGFDFGDAAAVAAQQAAVEAAVLRYKDHPAVLLWGLGNEMEMDGVNADPRLWSHLETLAQRVHALDPHHPTMTVTADIGDPTVPRMNELCPSIDIHGVNAYGGAASLVTRYREAGGTRPLVLTEFGPNGTWEIGQNAFGAVDEPTSTEKASAYVRAYRAVVVDAPELTLGSYAFTWGHKTEATATWFGLLLPDGTTLGAVDALSRLWTGQDPPTRAPTVSPLRLSPGNQVAPGDAVTVTWDVSDADGDPLTARWVLTLEQQQYATFGDAQPTLPSFPDAVKEARVDGVTVIAPQRNGVYRLYAEVRDGTGKGATASAPLLVGERPPADAALPISLPAAVIQDGEPQPWAPSGWMGDTDGLQLDTAWTDDPHSGEVCTRMRFAGPGGWAGIGWQHPAGDWGERPGGFDLTGARELEIWMRGRRGGERVSIGFGLLDKGTAWPDSDKVSGGDVLLKDTWKRYRIKLKGLDLSRVRTPLVITVPGQGKAVEFYVDDVVVR